MNFPIPLFALLAARKANDSPADAGRIALVSMVVKPSILGLLLAVVMAKNAARPPAPPPPARSRHTSRGASVLNQVAPETDLHSFFPSFIQFTRNQALEFATELRLKVTFVEAPSGPSNNVISQEPQPGAGWPPGHRVTLQLG